MNWKAGKIYATELVPLSLCDYPGEPATVVFLSGCNFDCGYCQNWRLKKRLPRHAMDMGQIKELLQRNSLVNACKVTGGEPLLQAESLMELGKFVKSLGLKFGIDTNGSNPDSLKLLIPFLDLVSVDIKTRLTDYDYAGVVGEGLPVVSKVKETLRLILSSEPFADIRMVVIPGKNDSLDIARSINDDLKSLGYCSKAERGGAAFTLVEFVADNAHLEKYRRLKNTSVDQLRKLANAYDIGNVRITHRGLGFCVRA